MSQYDILLESPRMVRIGKMRNAVKQRSVLSLAQPFPTRYCNEQWRSSRVRMSM